MSIVGAVASAVVSAVSGVNPADTLAEAERGPAFAAHMTMLGSSVVLMCSFWASYGWSLVLAIVAFVTGCIAFNHLYDLEDVKRDRCCCTPTHALNHIYMLDISVAVLAPVSCVTSVLGIIFATNEVFLAFAIISLVSSFALLLSAAFGFMRISSLSKICQEHFRLEMVHGITRHEPLPVTVQTYPVAQPAYAQYPQAEVLAIGYGDGAPTYPPPQPAYGQPSAPGVSGHPSPQPYGYGYGYPNNYNYGYPPSPGQPQLYGYPPQPQPLPYGSQPIGYLPREDAPPAGASAAKEQPS